MHKAGMERIPISGAFELTPMCNFSCKMCYVRKTQTEVNEAGGLIPVEKWLEWADMAKKEGMLYLLITGGEPFSYPRFWELYEKLAMMGFVITINSNASLITEEIGKQLSYMPPKKINITLYGASNEMYESLCGVKNAFDRVKEAVDILKKYNIAFKFNCSITKHNVLELKSIYEFAKKQNVPIQIATYMFPPVRSELCKEIGSIRLSPEEAGKCTVEIMEMQLTEQQFQAYARQKIKFQTPVHNSTETINQENGQEMTCRAGRCSFWLDWQGKLSSCGMINEPRYCLNEQSFSQAWKNIVDDTNQILCQAGCANCSNKRICHACIATAYCETGDIHGRPEYICQMLDAEAKACKIKLNMMNINE